MVYCTSIKEAALQGPGSPNHGGALNHRVLNHRALNHATLNLGALNLGALNLGALKRPRTSSHVYNLLRAFLRIEVKHQPIAPNVTS